MKTRSGLHVRERSKPVKLIKKRRNNFVTMNMVTRNGSCDEVQHCLICHSKMQLGTIHGLIKCRHQQCGNIFHASCFWKWIDSAPNATCPACRNHIDLHASSLSDLILSEDESASSEEELYDDSDDDDDSDIDSDSDKSNDSDSDACTTSEESEEDD